MTTISTEGRNWSMLAHASGAVNLLVLWGFGFLAPGLLWFLKRDDAEVAPHARSAFFFQLGIAVTMWALAALGAVFACFFVGWIFWLAGVGVWLAGVVLPLVGAARVNNGRPWSYPLVGPRDRPRITG